MSACNAGDLGSIPGLGRSPGEGNGNPLQYSCLENPMDGGAWWATVHGVAKSWTRLSDFTFTFIKRLFSSSSLSAIRVVSSAHLRLLIFLPAILIPACASSSPVFLMMYSAYKLNKVKVKSLSRVRLFAIPWTVAHQALLSMGFSRQEY